MWISKQEHEELNLKLRVAEQNASEWKAKYEAITKGEVTIMSNDAIIISTKTLREMLASGDDAKKSLEILRQEIEGWKQKYADEVQKRLTLIEQIKG